MVGVVGCGGVGWVWGRGELCGAGVAAVFWGRSEQQVFGAALLAESGLAQGKRRPDPVSAGIQHIASGTGIGLSLLQRPTIPSGLASMEAKPLTYQGTS